MVLERTSRSSKRYCLRRTNFSRSSTLTVVSSLYGTGQSRQLGETSLRKITKLAKSLSALPSTYSVGRFQVSATPSALDFATKLVINFGVASSGARGSLFLPQAFAATA